MSQLEEESSKKHIIVDKFEDRMNHLKTAAFSLTLALLYTAYLWFVCSTSPSTTSSLLLFGSQIAIGFPATRAYYEWGVSNKEKLHFFDPAKLNGKGKQLEIDIHLGDLPLFFEKMDLQIRRYDKGSFDDLSDIAWFGIFVWAAVSSSLFYLSISGHPLSLAGSLVLMLACAGSYLSGYWKARSQSFEDDLSHLQYFVTKRYKDIDNHLPESNIRVYVQMKEQWRTIVLTDFSIKISLGSDSAIEFHMGLSSTEKERIVIKAEEDVLNRVYNGAQQLPEVKENRWFVERIITPSGPIVRILNESSDFSITNRTSYVKSPSLIDESSKMVGTIFSHVLDFTT
jgi:hypothetical protein